MGALHEGHLSLIRKARKTSDFVIVSIFVNPMQFGPSEDLKAYPRPMRKDLRLCRKEEADMVFAPSSEEMYPGGSLTYVGQEKGLINRLCGKLRPGHFRGVMTVVAKLFNIIEPDRAYFGQKDAQQTIIIRHMVRDLDMNVQIVVCPTVRETDGFAISSRNAYLTPRQRREAPVLYESLQRAKEEIKSGEEDATAIIGRMKRLIRRRTSGKIDYVAIVDPETLENVTRINSAVLVALAVRIGKARLIDNMQVAP
jgi:pantoate--beta-alanine ligase